MRKQSIFYGNSDCQSDFYWKEGIETTNKNKKIEDWCGGDTNYSKEKLTLRERLKIF